MRIPKKIKMILILLPILLIVSFGLLGFTAWHTGRNQHNQLPQGALTRIEENLYTDQKGLQWELQPQIKNKFHQPDQAVPRPENPYPLVEGELDYDPDNPNLKFLSPTANGGSYEAILQPDGSYLTTGIKQGTYNYSHPSGFWGSFKHALLDVIPHFVNMKYKGKA